MLEAEPPLEVGPPVAVVPPLELPGKLVAGAVRDLALLLKYRRGVWRGHGVCVPVSEELMQIGD